MKQGTTLFPSVDLKDGRKLTLAVLVEEHPLVVGKLRYFTASFGYSIKNPLDEQNEKLGNIIAEGRAKNKPFAIIGLNSKGVSKHTLSNLAKVLQDEFEHRLDNYITTSTKRQPRETKVLAN